MTAATSAPPSNAKPHRKRTAFLLALLVGVAALGVYVFLDMRPRPQVEPTVIVLTESWNNSWAPVGPGQSVRIELDSSPDSGHRWKLLEGKATPAPEIYSPDPLQRTGGGTRLQPFVVQYADLPTTVKIALLPPMADQPPAQIFTVTLKRR